MGELVGVIDTSHAHIDSSVEDWVAARAARDLRPEVHCDADAERSAKRVRIVTAVETLRAKLEELAPDALVIIGDDQNENFAEELVPSLAIYLGASFSGRTRDATPGDPHQEAPGHPDLALAILQRLFAEDFDPAFLAGLPRPERGIGHAIMNPLGYFTDYTLPAVPVLLNALFAPQVTARRARLIGQAVRRAIEEFPGGLRVVVIGSGGLWHTGNSAPGAYLDEDFDRRGLEHLVAGDTRSWAEHFDSYRPAQGDRSQDVSRRGTYPVHPTSLISTGYPSPSGPQYGTRETLNWIAASATAEGRPFHLVDYVPVFDYPIGLAFAYCDRP